MDVSCALHKDSKEAHSFGRRFFPKHCVHTSGSYSKGWAWVWSRVRAGVFGKFGDYRTQVPRASVLQETAIAEVRSHLRVMSAFGAICTRLPRFVAGMKLSGHFESKASFTWQMHNFRRFSSAWQAWHFLHVANTLAGVGRKERWFLRLICVAGAVFACWTWKTGLKRSKVSLFIWNIVTFCVECGRCKTSDASGSFFVAGAILQRSRRESARSPAGKTLIYTCSMIMFHGARGIWWNPNRCSGNPLLTLCMSDRSRCGAVLILSRGSCTEIFTRRSCQEVSVREIFPRDLL